MTNSFIKRKLSIISDIPFYIYFLAIGEILLRNGEVSANDIQRLFLNDDMFKMRVELPNCIIALDLMETYGFIKKKEDSYYYYERA